MGKILTIANQKGGVGKTTTVMNFGVALAKEYRVLLIDSDPQANLTSYLGVTPYESPYESVHTLDELYLSKRPLNPRPESAMVVSTPAGPDLIPADSGLTGIEYYLFSRSDKETVLAQFLTEAKEFYDYILIDTPPNLNLLTLNALTSSDYVVVPVQPEFFSLEGIVKIREAVGNIAERWNPRLKILGVLPTQVNLRRKLTQEALKTLRKEMTNALFESFIHDNAAVAESSGHAQSVIEYQRSSRGAQDYLSATREMIHRIMIDEEEKKNERTNGEKPLRD